MSGDQAKTKPVERPSSYALVVGDRRLNRAAFAALLERWAAREGLRLVDAAPRDAARRREEAGETCALIVLLLGSASLLERETRAQVEAVRAAAPDAPLALLSDRCEPEEAIAAFHCGARGFVTADAAPEIALHGLSFIRVGGSYFPPAALARGESADAAPSAPQAADESPAASARLRRPCALDPHLSAALRGPSGGARSGDRGEDDRGEDGRGEDGRGEDGGGAPEGGGGEDGRGAREGGGGDQNAGGLAEAAQIESLTARQREVLAYLGEGQSNKMIARTLGMTESTVKVHLREIMRKLGVSNRTQAVVYALKGGGRPGRDAARTAHGASSGH